MYLEVRIADRHLRRVGAITGHGRRDRVEIRL
jgi:hypothetical protein